MLRLLVASLALVATPLPAVAADDLGSTLQPLLEPLLDDFAGFSVAVSRAGEIVLSEGMGWADVGGRVEAARETRYTVFSVAKAWTAALAARLVEEQRVGMNDPIGPLVPDWPDDKPPITLLQLATHSSGVRHYRDESEALAPGHCTTVADALPIFAGDPLVHEPGKDRGYSSWGFVLLSAAIEGAAEMPFDRVLRERILEPAGMTATVHADPDAEVADRAKSYRRAGDGFVEVGGLDSSCKWGAGGYLSTAEDLVRFYLALFDGRLLGEPSVQLLTRGAKQVRFGGSSVGGRSQVLADRDRGVIVAIAANTQARDVDLHAVLLRVVDAVAGDDPASQGPD